MLIAATGGAIAAAGLSVAARTGLLDGPGGGGARVLQLAGGAMGVESLDVPLTTDTLATDGPRRWRSDRLATSTHTMVGFTWQRGEPEPRVEISSLVGGGWRPWQRVPHGHDVPDEDSGETSAMVGTGLAWIGPATGIRVVVRDHLPAGLTMVLLYPNPLPGDRVDQQRSGLGVLTAREMATGVVPPPDYLSRSDWGADEDLRERPASYNDTIKQVHVHHTVNSNDYRRKDVPALIRGMYAYHTRSLGWSDIGYNFLVDRFGRIWVGRAGGPARPVRGAHTLGFNATSCGVSVIGNFEEVTPDRSVLAAIASVAAWKLNRYGRHPLETTTVVSEGSDRFRAGVSVTLPVIDGHRDTNETACPGQHLYDALPAIRRRTHRRIKRFARPPAEITTPFTIAGDAVVGSQLAVRPGAWTPADAVPTYTWLRDRAVIPDATDAVYRLTSTDLGAIISARVAVAPDGYQPATRTLTSPGSVKARTTLDVRALPRRGGRLVVHVTATLAGFATAPTGDVTVAVAGRSHVVTLVDGYARTAFYGLVPQSYHVVVTYDGDGTASAARTETDVGF